MTQSIILNLVGLGLTVVTLICLVWVITQIKQLKAQAAKAVSEEVLSREAKANLKKSSAEQYEAIMARELKAFETQLNELSTELLTGVRTQVTQADTQVAEAATQLTGSIQAEYQRLITGAGAQLKAHLAEVEASLTNQTKAMDTALAGVIEERKAVVIRRVDTQLTDILSNYLNATLEQLDLSNQEKFILAKLEEIKPQLKEDLQSVK